MKTLIGVVTGNKLGKFDERIAWIWPLFDVTNSDLTALTDQAQEFPPRGSIFWPRATTNAVKDALIHFRAKEVSVPKEGGDEFMAVDAQPVLEILDLRSVGNCEQVRRALSSGLQLPGLPAQRPLIWCKGDYVVGPVSLVTGANHETTIEKNNRAQIPSFQLGPGEIRQFEYDGATRLIIPKANLGPPYGYVDWDDDKQVVRRAIEYGVERAKASRGSVEFSRHMIDEAAEELTKNGSSADLRLRLYRLERSRSLAADVKQLAAVSDEVVAALLKHPSVAKEIAQLKLSERETARTDAEAALTSEREELARVKEKRSAAQAALSNAQKSLADTEALIAEQTRSVEAKINERIKDVLSAAPALLADIALLRPFLGGTRTSSSASSAGAIAAEIAIEPWKPGTNRISNAKELRARLIASFKGRGLPTAAYQPLHAAFASGLLPVVAGSRAVEALVAYAHAATAGRSLIVQATTSVADVQDLFGRVAARRFIPHPAGLIDIVRAARKSEGLFLVILDGINRGATESFLLPLMRAAVRRCGAIALFHPAAVEAGDPYRAEAALEWPRNLLLAATLVEGPTTLPVAPDVWSDSVLIQMDLEGAGGLPSESNSGPSDLDPSGTLLGAAPSAEHCEWIHEVVPSVRSVAERFEGGLRVVSNEAAAIQQNVVKGVIIPFLASIEDDAERATQTKAAEKAFGKSLEGWISSARRRVS
jgi:hypothetical protein